MKGKKLKYCILCLGIIAIAGMIALAIYNFVERATDENKAVYKSKDLIQYLGEAWDIELGNYVKVVEGEVKMHEDEEDTGVIKVKVLKEYEETVIELLKDNFLEIDGDSHPGVLPFPSNSLVKEVETKEWEYTFLCLGQGKYAKTKRMIMLSTRDDHGMYIYFWE